MFCSLGYSNKKLGKAKNPKKTAEIIMEYCNAFECKSLE